MPAVHATTEIRWFRAGLVVPSVRKWFESCPGQIADQPPRTDYYLVLGGTRSLGIKMREGRLEIKSRQQELGRASLGERVSGMLEEWLKWSFELLDPRSDPSSITQPDSNWIGVHKTRRLRRYGRSDDESFSPVPVDTFPPQGCDVELSMVRIHDQVWWTLAFESFGPPADRQQFLMDLASQLFEKDPTLELAALDSFGYPRWLAQYNAQNH